MTNHCNQKSTKIFPMSLRCTAYIARKPCKGSWKTQSDCYSY